MKQTTIFIVFLMFAVLSLSGQGNNYSPCYNDNMRDGDKAFKQGKYNEARTYYVKAKQCNGGNPAEAQRKINLCNDKIDPTPPKVSVTTDADGNQIFTVGNVTFKMVYVEGGTFTMGCTSEQGGHCSDYGRPPYHQVVTLSDYCMGETEVTQALWQAVMGHNPSEFKGDNQPVEKVSWDDCQKFIRKLNALTGKTFRLPTEAEWEYAARGGNKSKGYIYAGGNSINDVAWNTNNSGSSTHPVKGKQANELGLYDMSGNVSEWCSDWYGSYSSSSQTNPTGPFTGTRHVCRGGGYCHGDSHCRVSFRDDWDIYTDWKHLGFRLSLVHE